jgi:hypothetical protein
MENVAARIARQQREPTERLTRFNGKNLGLHATGLHWFDAAHRAKGSGGRIHLPNSSCSKNEEREAVVRGKNASREPWKPMALT